MKMKTKVLIVKVLLVALFVGVFCAVGYLEHNYTRRDCVVIESTDDGIMVEDTAGYTWYYEGVSYPVGTRVDLKMYDNVTSAWIDDDVIKKVVVRGE